MLGRHVLCGRIMKTLSPGVFQDTPSGHRMSFPTYALRELASASSRSGGAALLAIHGLERVGLAQRGYFLDRTRAWSGRYYWSAISANGAK